VSTEDDLRRIVEVRRNSRVLVSLGDCAVTSNVPGMRNPYGPQPILDRAYLENATLNQQIPTVGLPALLPESQPVHAVVKVDVFLPGCPPSADRIFDAIDKLLSGQAPDVAGSIFG
jgi:NAD-reducing hydrogenase small subunit